MYPIIALSAAILLYMGIRGIGYLIVFGGAPGLEGLARWWCRSFHKGMYRPHRGVYRCRKCLREYVVEWDITSVERINWTSGLRTPGYRKDSN